MAGWVSLTLALGGRALAAASAAVAGILLAGGAVLLTQRAHRAQSGELRAALAAAGRRERELERLRQLAAGLLAGDELEALLTRVSDAARELLECKGGAVYLVSEEGRFLRITATSGVLAGHDGKLMPLDRSLAGWAFLHGERVLCDDMDADPRSFPVNAPGLGPRACALVPLATASVMIGAIGAYDRLDGRPFGADDLRLLEALAELAVLGLDRATGLEELRRNEAALAAKNRELARAARLKGEFLANMSHELRTPLNSIIGFSELLLAGGLGELTPVQRESLDAVRRNGRHLLELINNVLDLSRIEAGRMPLRLGPVDLRGVIGEAVRDTASLRDPRGQSAEVLLADEDLGIVGDAQRVRQVLLNLLSNAAKFTPDGGAVTVTASRTRALLPAGRDAEGRAAPAPRDAVAVAVRDTGPGIPPGDLARLFVEFSQLDGSASRSQPGTGLGLALSRQFVELHGGSITAESSPGAGTEFRFLLPVDGPLPAAPPPTPLP